MVLCQWKVDHWHKVALGEKKGHIYSRNTNPTVEQFEEKVRILEQVEAATSFSTGMAAISNTLLTLLRPGQRVVSIKDTYGGTNKVCNDILPNYGINVSLYDTTDHELIEAEVAKGCDILYLETPTNPTLKVVDIKKHCQRGQQCTCTSTIDFLLKRTFTLLHITVHIALWSHNSN